MEQHINRITSLEQAAETAKSEEHFSLWCEDVILEMAWIFDRSLPLTQYVGDTLVGYYNKATYPSQAAAMIAAELWGLVPHEEITDPFSSIDDHEEDHN